MKSLWSFLRPGVYSFLTTLFIYARVADHSVISNYIAMIWIMTFAVDCTASYFETKKEN